MFSLTFYFVLFQIYSRNAKETKEVLKINEKRLETFARETMEKHEKRMNKFEANQDKIMTLLDENSEKRHPKFNECQETQISELIKDKAEDQNRRLLIFEDNQKRMVDLVENQEARMTQMLEMCVLLNNNSFTLGILV